MNKTKYISTTLPYANSVPHIGHAFEFIIGDALSRYWKNNLDTEDVYFNIGIDEHGQKIKETSDKLGVSIEEYLDDISSKWKNFCDQFNIDADIFYRTSNEDHHKLVQKFWIESLERGDIYKKKYKGLYCVGCESFKVDKDLTDDKCLDHPNLKIQEVEEENYFFRLSNYKEDILNHVSLGFLTPRNKRKELTNIVENLEDISISRLKTSVSHGVPVPNDPEQTIYVWFDALLNYIFTINYYDDPEVFDKFWQDTIQICGPDNIRFQGAIWQGILASAGIKGTKKLLVHGTILDSEGRKIGKSLGNVIDPVEQQEKYGVDAVRYYCLAGLSTYGNSNWDEEQLVDIYNKHLANGYGNLITRTLHLIDIKNVEVTDYDTCKFTNGIISDEGFSISCIPAIEEAVKQYNKAFEQNDFNEAIKVINKLVDYGNKHINDLKPWEKHWGDSSVTIILSELYHLISTCAELFQPIIPNKVEEIGEALQKKVHTIIFEKIPV